VLRAALIVCCTLICVSACSHAAKPAREVSGSAAHSSTSSPSAGSGSDSAPNEQAAMGDTAWRITRLGQPSAIEGWVDRASVLPGEAVNLYVSTASRHWQVTAYRMGWYGGALAERVWQSGSQPGVRQAKATISATTNTVVTTWRPSLRLPTANWEPGAYLLRLDGQTGQRYVPLTVRSLDTTGRTVLVLPVTTWQAYNDWGGYSLYHGPGGLNDFDDRSVAVSFDRPYTADGASDFVGSQLALIAHAERLGIPLAYATDIDLHAVAHLLAGARAVISLGHDEYWSTAMRKAVTAARDAGTNVAFLSANAVFRHIRFARSRTGPNRIEINYKRTSDPLYGKDDAEVTVDWREPPLSDPESSLTGAYYECNPVDASMVITDPHNWLFAGTGAKQGMRLPHLVGSEYDRVNPGVPTPINIEVLTHSPVKCRGVDSFSDSAYYTTIGSKAGVFDAGTSWFSLGLPEAGATGVVARIIGGELTNLLTAFSEGPAGLVHPAHRNIDALHEYIGDPIYAALGP
jgi:hypothetical protein